MITVVDIIRECNEQMREDGRHLSRYIVSPNDFEALVTDAARFCLWDDAEPVVHEHILYRGRRFFTLNTGSGPIEVLEWA